SRLLAAVGSCPASPFVAALKAAGTDDKHAAAAIAALLELPAQAAPTAAPALARLIEKGPPDLAADAARAAGHLRANGAGPALVAVVRRERKALAAERAAPRRSDEEADVHAAAELAQQAARIPAADRGKYDALMKKLAARGR